MNFKNKKFDIYQIFNALVAIFATLLLISIIYAREFTDLSRFFMTIAVICEIPLTIKNWCDKKHK